MRSGMSWQEPLTHLQRIIAERQLALDEREERMQLQQHNLAESTASPELDVADAGDCENPADLPEH